MSPAPIPIKPKSHYDSVSETSALVSCSYLSSSPIAQEIIASDLAQCLEDCDCHYHHGDDHHDDISDTTSEFGEGHLDVTLGGPLISQPSGVAYGTLRPTVAAGVPGTPALNPRDLVQSRMAERSLLRDNHILPPKHPRPFEESSWRKLYRRLFSTKVQTTIDEDDFGPGLTRASTKALESTPLLQDAFTGAYSPTPSEQQFQWDAAVAANILKTTWQREAQTLGQYSRSLIVTFLLHYSVTVTSVFTVGRIGRLELGAVSLATMTANITCYAPVQGLSTCLDTLCAQAYGSGHKHLVGLQLQRMTYLLWMLLLPIVALWWFSGHVLGSIIPDPDTAALAGMYLRVLILGTPGVAAFESGKRFVQAQGLFHATTFVLLIGAPVNVLANWFFVWRLELGFSGAAAAVVFTQNLLPFLLFLYVRFIEGMECWNGLSRRAFSNWGPMIKLALPGMIMVEAQYFAFEVLTLAASQFGSAHLAAQSVLVTVTSTTFNIPFPLSIAASTRVANLIGARLSGAARTSAKVALVAGCLVGCFNLTLLSSLRFKLPYLFTNDEEVATIVSNTLPICAVLQIFDSLAAISHGLLRGIGRQGIGGYTNLGSYYLVALPISFSTGWYLGWKLDGLWFGVAIGLAVVSSIELCYLYHADWEHAVDEAEARLQSDQGHQAEIK
ncbi:mate-domain-containing protein [Podospora aff. communis PSN243]|uniref:Mate-domain-containing protein n=1 Tax=Podospora aff. communis PSN243 TaxID=3040156 RepID=A0AAV9H3V5_9PEZI|nr:mate-domain-containing protein [Podospora aff. communis PSN243]